MPAITIEITIDTPMTRASPSERLQT
jgi:hypothetical protein